MRATSRTDLVGGSQRMKDGVNPMAANSMHKLRSEGDGLSYNVIGPENNLNDILFFPMNCLVFNAPFDYDNLTYHMKIQNNSHHRIAYVIKGNCIPRVMANPPAGILELKEKRYIAVTAQKFDYNDSEYLKDRISFDYVILPDDNKDQHFDFKLLANSDSRRRKNILIKYNP